MAGLAGLALGMPTLPAIGAKRPIVVLTCTNLVSRASWNISIDFQAGTVDSNPARISRTTISWRDPAHGGRYTLDRNSGNLTVVVASSTGGYFVHDRCEPQH